MSQSTPCDERARPGDLADPAPRRTHLVTGGAGFIGSHLVVGLLARGDDVVVLDDLSTGDVVTLFDRAGADVDRLRVVEGSVLDEQLVARLVAEVDHVFHLAAVVGLAEIARRPGATERVSVEGSRAVVSAVRATPRVRSLLFTSSSEVYGDGPFDDSLRVATPRGDGRGRYAHAKHVAERVVARGARDGCHSTVIARLFNTVGPGQGAGQGLVLARWREQLRNREPLTVFDDGAQTRCFSHVEDVARVLIALALDVSRGPGSEPLVVNVGSDRPVSIGALAERAVELAQGVFEHPVSVCFLRFRQVYGHSFRDPRARRPELARLRAVLGGERMPSRPIDAILTDALGLPRAVPQSRTLALTGSGRAQR